VRSWRTLLTQLAARRTVLLSTHIVDDVAQSCTELAVLGRAGSSTGEPSAT
jgi:ABC-type multidrug transport system ATPase subunit